MAKYATTMAAPVASGLQTVGNIVGSTTGRVKVYDFTISASGTPADNTLIHTLQRSTTAGTLTGVVEAALDPADAVATATSGEDATIEPTYTSAEELWENAINQRATYRWVAAPGGELVVPAAANNGVGWQTLHAAYTGNVEVTAHFEE